MWEEDGKVVGIAQSMLGATSHLAELNQESPMTKAITPTSTSIDLVNPGQACHHLGVSEDGLLRLVNEGRLGAFNIGGQIRFRLCDVLSARSTLAAAS